MSKALQWVIGICAVLLVITVAVSVLVPLFVPSLRTATGFNHGGMMGGYWGEGGRGGMMRGGFGLPFFGFGMLIGPVLFLAAAVWGISWLIRTVSRPAAPAVPLPAPAPALSCAHCQQPLEGGWKVCPYCGEKIE